MSFDLTAYLPYLINRTGVELAGAFSREIAHHGVTLQMWRVLAALHHRDGLRISDLASLTSIDISTLSRLIGKMEKRLPRDPTAQPGGRRTGRHGRR